MTLRRFVFGLLAAFLLISPAVGYFARPGETSIPIEQRLRNELRKERRQTVLIKAINRRLVRAYMDGPGYQSPRQSSWECIAEGETHKNWTDDSNPKYKGGLQFDSDFEITYGPEFVHRWGRANDWPKWAQIIAADRGHAARGYSPWPRTARRCGLL